MWGVYILFICWLGLLQSSPTYAADTGRPPLVLSMILRDFKANGGVGGHPDFENIQGDERGITRQYLTSDKKPAYNVTNTAKSTTHGEALFNVWYRDSSYCIEVRDEIVLTWNTAIQKYVYYNNSFFPLDFRGWGNEGHDEAGKAHNYGFTAEFSTIFTYYGNETFTFTGDDDVWVYVNDYRIIDLGGVHVAESQSVSLSRVAAAASLQVGKTYNFNFFFAERHTVESVFRIETSVALQDCPKVDACGVCNGNATINKCTSAVNCGHGTCDCYTGCCKCAVGWSQATPCAPCSSFCGNGIIEPGEQCDPASTSSDAACCNKFCNFVSQGASCEDNTVNVCKSSSCDGKGHCSSAVLTNSSCVPANPSQCTQNLCDGNGNCGIPISVGGICDQTDIPCTQMICGASGACIQTQQSDGTACAGSYTLGECASWSCKTGKCIPAPLKLGNVCASSNLCTSSACDGTGNCISKQNITQCESTNPCVKSIGTCDPSTGGCLFSLVPDGSACVPSNRQNCATYKCSSGNCIVARDLCEQTPSSCDSSPKCNMTTGKCVSSPETQFCCGDGRLDPPQEFCDDGNAGCCIANCNAWADSGAPCIDYNPCSNSTCDGFGKCIVHPLPIGTPCGDSGNLCTRLVCQAKGVCAAVPQSGSKCGDDTECTKSTCNNAGLCELVAKTDNTPCNGSSPASCMSSVCKQGTCNKVHVPDATKCGNNSCGSFQCSLGTCAPGPDYKSCPSVDSCHTAGICDPQTGVCSNPLQADGMTCPTPSQSICQIWTCLNGACNASCPVTLPFCGNGIVEFGEDCDSSNNTCCVDCHFQPAGSSCLTDRKECTIDQCDSHGVCQHIQKDGCSLGLSIYSHQMYFILVLAIIFLL